MMENKQSNREKQKLEDNKGFKNKYPRNWKTYLKPNKNIGFNDSSFVGRVKLHQPWNFAAQAFPLKAKYCDHFNGHQVFLESISA